MNLSPRGIREHLHLNRPIYVPTSAYGHFGREPDEEKGTFTWEKTDLVPALKVSPRALKPPPERLYGRSRGHRLRPRQLRLLDVTLPRLAFDAWQAADPLVGLHAADRPSSGWRLGSAAASTRWRRSPRIPRRG